MASHLPAGRTLPVLLVLASAVMWGLWWLPIRALEEAGLTGAWAGVAMAAGALPLIGAVWAFGRGGVPMRPRAVAGAATVGLAIMLYATSITLTDVVRAVLFFYLAPAWSIAIECLFFGRRWRAMSGLSILLALAGIVALCHGEIPFGGASAAGDWMALASGLCWSAGSALVFSSKLPSVPRIAFAAVMGALVSGLAIALLVSPPPDLARPADAIPLAFGTGVLYLAPIVVVTMWGAIRLPPATMSFLLTAEILSGVASSALLAGEPFGLLEATGAALVTLGAMLELFRPDPTAKPA